MLLNSVKNLSVLNNLILMKKRIAFSLFLVLLMGSTAFSQKYVFAVQKKGSNKWGYASLDGTVIIEPKFTEFSDFSENGYALVIHKVKYSIIKQIYHIEILCSIPFRCYQENLVVRTYFS